MYKPYKDWLNFVQLTNDYPIAFTFEVEECFKPILSLKNFSTLCECIEACNQIGYDYDYTVGYSELTKEEQNKLTELNK